MATSVSEEIKERNCHCSTRNVLLLVFVTQVVLIVLYFNFTKVSGSLPLWGKTSLDYAGGRLQSPTVYRDTDVRYQKMIQNLTSHTDIIIRFQTNQTDQTRQLTSIAVGMGITGRGWTRGKVLEKHFIFFSIMLPSFCQTASQGYHYVFYLAFDDTDIFFSTPSNLEKFRNSFVKICHSRCSHLSAVDIVFIKCGHHGKPAWAQNDAMMAAYMDDMEYFYRINDDTKMASKGWTETFTSQLLQYMPPNVGVVGPNHKGGNTAILTYDFVHHWHIDLLGFYYPREFTDWHADRWITDVYKPGRITKMNNVSLVHTMSKGTRYKVHRMPNPIVIDIVQREKDRVLSGINLLLTNITADPRKVISMTLTGAYNADIFGAVRNAVLRQMYFPEWTMQVFIEKADKENGTKYPAVPENVIRKLDRLQVQVILVNFSKCDIMPEFWPVLVAENTDVEYVIVRNPRHRLSERDAAVVNEWISSGRAIHCIRDHPDQSKMAIVKDLWGAKNSVLRQFLSSSNNSLDVCSRLKNENSFSLDMLWTALKNDSIVHDSVSCDKRDNTLPFPTKRHAGEYLGQLFGACGEHKNEPINLKECQDNGTITRP